VLGADDTVNESLKSMAGAFASGVSGRTYGTSGCLEYGKIGNTVMTPPQVSPPTLNTAEHGGFGGRGATSSRSGFAGTEHDKQFHQNLVDLACAGGDDEDVLVADTLLDLHGRLAVAELAEHGLALGDAEAGAD